MLFLLHRDELVISLFCSSIAQAREKGCDSLLATHLDDCTSASQCADTVWLNRFHRAATPESLQPWLNIGTGRSMA